MRTRRARTGSCTSSATPRCCRCPTPPSTPPSSLGARSRRRPRCRRRRARARAPPGGPPVAPRAARRRRTTISTAVDWSSLGDLGARVARSGRRGSIALRASTPTLARARRPGSPPSAVARGSRREWLVTEALARRAARRDRRPGHPVAPRALAALLHAAGSGHARVASAEPRRAPRSRFALRSSSSAPDAPEEVALPPRIRHRRATDGPLP